MGKKIIDEDVKNEMIWLYSEEGVSRRKLHDRFGYSYRIIDRILTEAGLELRNERSSGNNRKYSFDESYFENIDTPNKAYVFGFWLADGCVRADGTRVAISLKESDKYILENIKKELKTEQPLRYDSHAQKVFPSAERACVLEIHSQKICKQLVALGIYPRKSLINKIPNWVIDSPYFWDAMRGYFDGNGHIFRGHAISSSKPRFWIDITSSKAFCEQLHDILFDKFNINSFVKDPISSDNKANYRKIYIYKRDDIVRVLDYMYGRSELHLQRKYNKYLSVKKEILELKCG